MYTSANIRHFLDTSALFNNKLKHFAFCKIFSHNIIFLFDPKMDNRLKFDFVTYLIYRLFRFLCHFIQTEIIFRFNGLYNHLSMITSNSDTISASTTQTCQLLSIVYRKKIVEADMASVRDFLWWHDTFVDPDQLLLSDPNWTLYTLDRDFVYFVKMPRPWPFYNAREAPFVFMRQFTDATKLARMPLKAFCHFGEQRLTNPKGTVVYYSNAARSGSTLLTRVMQVSEEKIVCLGEPDAFTSLVILQQRGFVSENLTVELLKAIFKYYCKEQSRGQTYLMKVQSNGVRLVPFIKQAMPEVKHMFTYRRNTKKVLSSLEKILRGGTAGDLHVYLWNLWEPLACEFISAGSYEYEMYKKFGIKDVLDLAIICHVASWYYYQMSKNIFDIPLIYYEDLIAEKEKTLKNVFELCELPYDELIEVALKEFDYDSQAGTVLNQDNMKLVRDSELDAVKVLKIHDMCYQLKIPRIDA